MKAALDKLVEQKDITSEDGAKDQALTARLAARVDAAGNGRVVFEQDGGDVSSPLSSGVRGSKALAATMKPVVLARRMSTLAQQRGDELPAESSEQKVEISRDKYGDEFEEC